MNSILGLIGRSEKLFCKDVSANQKLLDNIVQESKFLVLGGAGSIGQAVSKEIFQRNPKKLHIVDISENNLVELVRDIRSSYGYIDGDFRTFSLDIGSVEYNAFFENDGSYDFILNLSALKHVRSEKDPYTLMRMIDTNIFNTEKTLLQAISSGCKKYFCVSTDKAANPVNLMGASKRIMELFLMRRSSEIEISTARFANVAFSDGSLLQGFNHRIQKRQPIVAPNDVRRYFVTPQESGLLCLMSCIFGSNRDVFFPKLSESLHLITFSEIAVNYLKQIGYEAYLCANEEQARSLVNSLPDNGQWPCLFSVSDTTGEKDFEEFYTNKEIIDLERYTDIGVIKNECVYDNDALINFQQRIDCLKAEKSWTKDEIVGLFFELIPDFQYSQIGKYLDEKM